MEKISVYTILYYDLQFYEDIIKNLYDIVDEFIIIDGPYSYAIDTLTKFNLFYTEDNKPNLLNQLIQKYSKIKYKYVICDTEEEKRMIGYNMCSNNLVLLVDTDEFLFIDVNKLNTFINKEKFVCCANIYNMCDYNINFNKLTQKYILFKKNKISALEHLNYTWLIGCKQTQKNINYMSGDNFGLIYHFTLNRNKQNNIVKFIFYVLLYNKINNKNLNLIDKYSNVELINILTIDEILNIFIHLKQDRINIPNDVNMLQIIENNENILYLQKYNNLLDFMFKSEMKCLLNIPINFRLNKKNEYILIFENVENINITLYYLYLNNEPTKITNNYTNIIDNKIQIQNNINENVIYVYIKIICCKTCNNKNIFKIKTII